MTFLFASMVIFRLLFENILHICFLICSICLGDSLNAPSPSSLYNSTFSLMFFGNWLRRYKPTSSQVSAPSNKPIVISKQFFDCLFIHAASSSNNSDCFAWRMILRSSGEISVCLAANLRVLSGRSLVIDG